MVSPAAGETETRVLEARGRTLALSGRTLVMGILNVTPDSFSDGGISAAPEAALATAHRLAAEGADILDIGGESTRPGHTVIPADEEWARIAPVLKALPGAVDLPVSVDTWKAPVAARALEAGAVIVNDIWGFSRDPDLARVTAEFGAAAILMHNQDEPQPDRDIILQMRDFFARALDRADAAGVKRERIVLDPGIGFGKTHAQNLAALARLHELRALGFPVLLGASRKSFIGRIVETTPQERLPGTLAAHAIGVMAGVEIIRVHDVAAHVQAARIAEAIRQAR